MYGFCNVCLHLMDPDLELTEYLVAIWLLVTNS